MAVTLYSTGTEYTSNAITLLRGTPADITAVGVYHDADPAAVPAVGAFVTVTLADGTTTPPSPLAVPGEVDVVALIGARNSADLALAKGTYQRWILIQTASQDIIRAVDTITVL